MFGLVRRRHQIARLGIGLLALIAGAGPVRAAPSDAPSWQALMAAGQLVEIAKVDSAIRIEMRYAGTRNCVGAPLYPPNFPCLARPQIAQRLHWVQQLLHERGYGLKIWDAYRPEEAQRSIWRRFARHGYVADPNDGRGSLHTWGLAVDVTIVDRAGKEIPMPSEFDDFTPAASALYRGPDPTIRADLQLLRAVMRASGFIGLSTEWWHFAARDWQEFPRLEIPPHPPPAAHGM
jgi:D-alanyl-D-alanine dipeptidase